MVGRYGISEQEEIEKCRLFRKVVRQYKAYEKSVQELNDVFKDKNIEGGFEYREDERSLCANILHNENIEVLMFEAPRDLLELISIDNDEKLDDFVNNYKI